MSDAPPSGMDRQAHKRYLEYRDRHSYFGKMEQVLPLAEYIPLEIELSELEIKGEDGRDDEEEARFAELARILFRD
ncbi:hypothetical protein BH11MYX4_BH11MYX4_54140 [soil metagenome]